MSAGDKAHGSASTNDGREHNIQEPAEEPAAEEGVKPVTAPGSLRAGFWPEETADGKERSIEELAAEQGVKPVTDFESLLGDFWPEDETADDFIAAVRAWRREGTDKGSE